MKRILITTLVGLTGLLVRSENRIVAGNDASSTGTLLSLGAGETLDYGLFSFGDDAAASAEAKSYVRFDMAGGLLRLGAEGWRVGSKWNACADPNSIYSVRLAGGTVKAADDTAIALDVTGAGNNRDVLTYGEADLSGVTAWIVLRDGLPVKAQVMDDVTHGRLRIKYARGLVLVFR